MGSKTLLNNCNVIYSEKIKRVFTLDNKTKSTALIAINSGLYNITITSGVRLVDFNYSLMYRYFIVNLAFFGNGSYYTLRNTIEFNILWIETPISINVNQTKHSKNILVKLPYYINNKVAVTSNKQKSPFAYGLVTVKNLGYERSAGEIKTNLFKISHRQEYKNNIRDSKFSSLNTYTEDLYP